MKVRIAGICRESVVDGPGIRYVIFAQGCRHNCPGCHNPETHDMNGGYLVEGYELVEDIKNTKHIDGVTLSGGDPFFQPLEFACIAGPLKKANVNIVAYTGFLYEDLIKNEEFIKLLKNIDMLVDGPFDISQKTFKLPFRGSKNQRLIDVNSSLKENRIKLMEY